MSVDVQQAAPQQAVPLITGVHHVGLTVRDVEASERWYERVLGLTREFVEPHANGTGYAVVMTCPGSALSLGLDHHADADGQVFNECRTGLDHLALQVESRADLDLWAARLDALGVKREAIHETSEPVPYALIVFRDLDEIQLEMMWFGA